MPCKFGQSLLLVSLFSASLYGQLASTTSLVGNVLDSGGAAIQGASVTALNNNTSESYSATTNAEGYYEVQFIKPGSYTITVRQSGFETIAKTGIPVATNQIVRTDFSLKVGQVSETVEVTADVPPIVTEDAAISEVISTKQTAELPLSGRNPLRLAITIPTVIQGRKNPAGNPGGGEGYIGAGTREIQNSISLDGISIMNNLITTATFRPSVDAVQETQVQTGTYPAQYGGYMGVQINLITKTGGNDPHGSVFYFVRNNAFDARNFFESGGFARTAAGTIRPQAPFRQNQFGFALTGPVVIPKLYNGKNRTFFLVNYEGLRLRQAVANVSTVLTPLMRQGNFSELTTQIRDPFNNNAPFAGNIIPANRISPQALRLLNYLPVATGPGVSNNFNRNVPTTNDTDQSINRVDQNFGEKTRLFFRYAFGNTDLVNESINPFNGYTQPVRDRNFVIGYTQVFTPTLVNDFRFGRQKVSIDSLNFFTGANANAGTEIGIPGFTTSESNPGLPGVGITGYLPIGQENMASSNWFQNDETWQGANVLSILRGAHNISTGFEVRRLVTARIANNNPRGGFTFSGQLTGSAPADFILGTPQIVTTPGPLFPAEVFQYRLGFFVSDKWQVSQKLTLTLGLRYELPTVPESLNGNATFLNREQTQFIPTTVPQSVGFIEPIRNNWAPRIGFAYRLTPRWVFRGGYGIYYNPNQLNSYTLLTTNPPFSTIFTYNTSATNLLTFNAPTIGTGSGPSARPDAVTPQPDMKTQTLNQWSFSIERALWKNAGLDVQYLGSKGTHLDRSYFPNTPQPGPGPINDRRPNARFGNIRVIQNDMISTYHALSFVVRQQYFTGLTGLFSYTWSKTLDVTTDSNGGGATMDPFNWKLDYGRSNWDLPHRFVASWTYELPFLRSNTNPLVKYALANWQLNGILVRQSGFPFNVTIAPDQANTGRPNQRPNLVGTPRENCGEVLIACIDSSAFALPTQFTYGNVPRNVLRGPSFFNLDFSIFKNFPITERFRAQLRGEAFNVTNTPSFSNPSSTWNTPQFGNIGSTANNSRQIQLALKLLF
jgi:outer membrane receptor protein involved in Fe transport